MGALTPSRRDLGRTALLALAALALAVAGCDLFKPAHPESGGGGVQILANYADPESSLKYMQIGIEAKNNAGQAAYTGALADTTQDGRGFHAFFDQADWFATTGSKPADWNWGYENQFYLTFTTHRTDPYQMRWLLDDQHPDEEPDPDHRILHRRYQVFALLQNNPTPLVIAVGYADLWFAKVSASRWVLTRWDDRRDPTVDYISGDPEARTFGWRRLNP